MTVRLVALDEGPDIMLDRSMVVVGRHPACDARLDSLRVSRHHCCIYLEGGEVSVRDLGSTNGIRINGQRVEVGRIRPGDELSIAHIRYRLEDHGGGDATVAEPRGGSGSRSSNPGISAERYTRPAQPEPIPSTSDENALAAAVRKLLPASVADKCKIQVIVEMAPERETAAGEPGAGQPEPEPTPNPESLSECHSDSSR